MIALRDFVLGIHRTEIWRELPGSIYSTRGEEKAQSGLLGRIFQGIVHALVSDDKERDDG